MSTPRWGPLSSQALVMSQTVIDPSLSWYICLLALAPAHHQSSQTFLISERRFTQCVSMHDLIMALQSDPALPSTGYENMGKFFHLSEPQLPPW